MRKWIAVASVALTALLLSAATFVNHTGGKCPLCWGK